MFPHKDGSGFNIMLQAFPLDGKIVCREIAEGEEAEPDKRDNGRAREDDEMRRERTSRHVRR